MADLPEAGRDPRAVIREAVEHWALWRDTGRWPQLRALYTADAVVHTTWFVGSASEFVERCMQAAGRGSRSQHFIGAVSVELNGGRAIAESRAMLLVRAPLHGVEVDATCWLRFYDWFVREPSGWRIRMRSGVYEKDRIDPVDPSRRIDLDAAELARYPAGYRHLAYLQAAGGARITPDLPIPGSDALARLYAHGRRWLEQGD
jgi:SnoaL-like domain